MQGNYENNIRIKFSEASMPTCIYTFFFLIYELIKTSQNTDINSALKNLVTFFLYLFDTYLYEI
jgi:hypothetical protein